MRLWQRLFLAFAALSGAALLGFVAWQQQNFRRGFLSYLDDVALQRLEPARARLAAAYAEHGNNWDFLRGDFDAFVRLIEPMPLRPPDAPEAALRDFPPPPRNDERPPPPDVRDDRPPHERHDPGEFGGLRRPPHWRGPPDLMPRLLLVDAVGAPVVGNRNVPADAPSLALSAEQPAIGALRLLRQPQISTAIDVAFSHTQLSDAVFAGAGILVGALARDFNQLASALERHREARRQWGADIAHELRTPLSILRGEIQALQDGVRAPTPLALDSLQAECWRLGALIDDLYQLALADAGALDYRFETLDLSALAATALAAQERACADAGLELDRALAPGIAVRGDARRLTQLVDNLLANARRYTDAPGRIRIELTLGDGLILLVVEDSAPGVPAEALPKLFERLYRVEASRSRAAGGAGLGLSICQAIVEAHGGTITAQHSALGGLRIVVGLATAPGTR